MSYSTFTSILTIVPNLPQTSSSNGYTTTVNVVSKHILRTDAMIDGFISSRYSVPISDSPLLTQISEDITAYFTYRSFFSQDNYNKSETFAEWKDTAFSTLKEIKEGGIDLVDSSGNSIAEKSAEDYTTIDSTTRGQQTFFDTDDSLNWKFDDDRQDNINGRR